ncbi:carboxymuconolactone decarboxylase family protein [Haloechinothrix sp. LS1_15]|uniref:carboxymuconolactone decarboxylase family protein n=1 Tax=Haloechinothrix sp. LS1_15 TaxID=2652248 RepID=UPI00294715DB|nr:carboxymuconolactone decarboxylase family protein [Haloechinothrix sp. LS1_15]MDV6013609.1 peroxidase [Haloechinothrix sp. LS1_15]
MSYLPSLPENATLLDVLRAYPDAARPLLDYHEAVLRGPSPLSIAQRELLAAYVSGLNACDYCHGIHEATAQSFGVEPGTLAALLSDIDSAPVEQSMKPVLRYATTLTEEPGRVRPDDARAVLDAGWEERTLHDAAAVVGLFNLMNRLVGGLGITLSPEYVPTSSRRLADGGYSGLKDLL